MLERLGNVLYWAACGLAVIWALAWLVAAFSVGGSTGIILTLGVAGAAVIWLVGRAVRYVLAAR